MDNTLSAEEKSKKIIRDIKGMAAEPGQIIRVYSGYYKTVIDEEILKAEPLTNGEVIYLCNWDGHFEVIGNVIQKTQPASQGDVSILTNALDKIYNGHFPNAYDQDARIVEMRVAAKSAVHAYQSSIK